jgi:hypothetical protein
MMTQTQKIIAGVVGFLFLVLAIVGLYFAFIKPTPKPTPRATPKATLKPTNTLTTSTTPSAATPSAATPSDATPSAATPSAATPSPATPEAEAAALVQAQKDLEPVLIEGKNPVKIGSGLPYTYRADDKEKKDKLITQNGGCWSFLDLRPGDFKIDGTGLAFDESMRNFGRRIFITSVTLPSDIKAEAWGLQGERDAGGKRVCNYVWKANIDPGETKTFTVPKTLDPAGPDNVLGLKFMRV